MINDGTKNGKPTWRNNETGHTIFYHGKKKWTLKQSQNRMVLLENGNWLIGERYQNVGGFKSIRTDLDDVPTEGWLYNDGTMWNNNDTTITVTGEGGMERTREHFRKSIF